MALKKIGFEESRLSPPSSSFTATTANAAAIYLKPPLPIAGIKYPKKTPVAAAGVYVSEQPAINEIPNGKRFPKTAPRDIINPTAAADICIPAAASKMPVSYFSFLFTELAISFNFNSPPSISIFM